MMAVAKLERNTLSDASVGNAIEAKLAELHALHVDEPPRQGPPPFAEAKNRPGVSPRGKWVALGLVGASAAIVAGAFGVAQFATPAATDRDITAVSQPAAPAAAAVQQGPQAVLSSVGFVVPRRIATVSAEVTGRVSALFVTRGSEVQAGALLARLDARTASSDRQIAVQDTATLSSRVAEAQSEYELAKASLNRLQSIDPQFVTRAALDERRQQVLAKAARVDQAQHEHEGARLRIGRSTEALDMFTVRAPFSGVVTDVPASLGEIVSPISTGGGFVRTGIATIVDMNSLEVETEIPEQHVGKVVQGQAVRLTLSAWPGKSVRGEVSSVKAEVNRDSGTVTVWVKILAGSDLRILPNMRAQLEFLGR